jgi:hypothetical protein
MSIIHDALKKVQRSMETNPSQVNPANGNPEEIVEVLPSSSPNTTKNPVSAFFLTLCAVIIIGGSCIYIMNQIKQKYPHFLSGIHFKLPFAEKFHTTSSKKHVISPSSNHPSTVNSLARVTIPVSNTPSENGPSSTSSTVASLPLILNIQGIMASGNQNLALINNNVYEEGSVIDGIKILKINLDALIIEHNGKQETVAVRK